MKPNLTDVVNLARGLNKPRTAVVLYDAHHDIEPTPPQKAAEHDFVFLYFMKATSNYATAVKSYNPDCKVFAYHPGPYYNEAFYDAGPGYLNYVMANGEDPLYVRDYPGLMLLDVSRQECIDFAVSGTEKCLAKFKGIDGLIVDGMHMTTPTDGGICHREWSDGIRKLISGIRGLSSMPVIGNGRMAWLAKDVFDGCLVEGIMGGWPGEIGVKDIIKGYLALGYGKLRDRGGPYCFVDNKHYAHLHLAELMARDMGHPWIGVCGPGHGRRGYGERVN